MVDLAKEVEDMKKVHQLPDKYHFEAYELRKKIKMLQDNLDNLALNNEIPDYKLIINSNNKDNYASQ